MFKSRKFELTKNKKGKYKNLTGLIKIIHRLLCFIKFQDLAHLDCVSTSNGSD